MRITLLLLALAACRDASGGDEPQPQPPPPVRIDNPASLRFHMHRHFDDLRTVERLLVDGKLADAKSLAYMLTIPTTDPAMAPWAADADHVTDTARSLVAAPSIDEALRREARVATACAGCHVRVQKTPIFAPAPATPRDENNTASAMARHQWAADRLWEGIVAGSAKPWRDGLDVFASAPLPYSRATDAPALAARMQELAQRGLVQQRDGSESLDERARVYGEILVTCAACHESTHHASTRRR